MSGPPEEALAELMSGHRPDKWRWDCECGEMPEATERTHRAEHRKHLAKVVADAGWVSPEDHRAEVLRLDQLNAEVDARRQELWRSLERSNELCRKAQAEALAAVEQAARGRALRDAEVADAVEGRVRAARGNVRCLDCNLRYDERQEYGCHESGRGHSYSEEELADVERAERADPVEYVTVAVADLDAVLAWPPPAEPAAAPRKPRLRACVEAWPDCHTFGYNPACCRFPKSCSCDVYDPAHAGPEDLEEGVQ
jgi:hypothetical protein